MATRSDATSTFEFVPADEESVASDTTSDHALLTGSIYAESSEDRDEKAVIEKIHERETFTVQIWRAMVTNVLVFTALAVTLAVHKVLADEQQKSFEQAFDQAALVVADQAVSHHKHIREAMSNLALVASSSVYTSTNNQVWPLVTIPLYELHAQEAILHAQTEFLGLWHRVELSELEEFTAYTARHFQDVTEEAHMLSYGNLERLANDTTSFKPFVSQGTPPKYARETAKAEYWPGWQLSPAPTTYETINWNIVSFPAMEGVIDAMVKLRYETTFTSVLLYEQTAEIIYADAELDSIFHAEPSSPLEPSEHPHMLAAHPVHQDPTNSDSRIVAAVVGGIALDAVFQDASPEDTDGIICVLKNNMGQTYSYELLGNEVVYLGARDFHDKSYDSMFFRVSLALHTNPSYTSTPGHAQYDLFIYPTATFEANYNNGSAEMLAAIVSITFVLVAGLFFVYDVVVQRRTDKVVSTAAQSNALVASIFPEHMMKRLMKENEEKQKNNSGSRRKSLKVFLNDDSNREFGKTDVTQKPLADLFLDTTVLIGDISGFTAWSSTREPFHVFTLLETLYQSFDKIARKRRVYKVETVGDSYVAVCGLPEAREDHAVVICRFARDMLSSMNVLTKELEITLGPGTGELGLRIGIHSGPVTAGVLRGDRARFQLFGDTMNTCSRLESTGRPNRIHTSKRTAQLLISAGKEAWLEKIDTPSELKGKGLFQTFFINPHGDRALTVLSSFDITINESVELLRQNESDYYDDVPGVDERTNRLINWNVEMLLQLMKQVAASPQKRSISPTEKYTGKLELRKQPLDEVQEIIVLPEFDKSCIRSHAADIHLPREVVQQLHLLVSKIALMYNDNPFHNFEHCSHVVMSCIKLMSRIAAPTHLDDLESDDEAAAAAHDHTYGITSDPLTQLACAFSALIHDVDHSGVSNVQLVKEGVAIAERYKQRSVAEQNSLDLSWGLLMDDQFEALRLFLFPTQNELIRFRQLVVNSVMSTDIVDKEMKELRNARWTKAFKKHSQDSMNFSDSINSEVDSRDTMNRKATIVIEHIIQASDISHTMQHWTIYRKWNQKLFEELYVAYLSGRTEKDPSDFWYEGEFGFFDFYIIPLTQKLKECGVFGVSSGEYLEYARRNREEWEEKGEAVVAGMIEECHKKYGVKEIEDQPP